MRSDGLTMAVKDRFDRLPLPQISLAKVHMNREWDALRLFFLQRRERGLCLIILAVFVLHVIVNTRDFLWSLFLAG